MNVDEVDAVLNWLDAYEEAQREAHEKLKRGR